MCVLDDHVLPEMMSYRNANLLNPSLMAGRMKDGIEMIKVLAYEAQEYSSQLEVRFFPYPTDITAAFIDPSHKDNSKKRALVRLQGFRVTFDDKIDFLINWRDSPDIYNLYIQQMNNIWLSSSKCLFLTGVPGIGKSTLLSKVVDIIPQTSLKVIGLKTKDIRNNQDQRVAFETYSLDMKLQGELARKNKHGDYILNSETMERVILPTLERGVEEADLLILDEVGPIQLQDPRFQALIDRALEKRSLSILGIVAKQGHPYLSQLARYYRTRLIDVDSNNRDHLATQIASEFQRFNLG